MKKILIVTAKWPYVSNSTDGGDSTLSELISCLGDSYALDIFSFRDNLKEGTKLNNVRNVFVHKEDFAVFKNYSLHNNEKFMVRLVQARTAAEEIIKVASNYDILIIQHVMFILALTEYPDILNKIILYPMFTGTSYQKSGEQVPNAYLDAEKKVINKVKAIFTPSNTEKEQLVKYYSVDENNIRVIPRPVKYKYLHKYWSIKKTYHILYIASVRLQKDHLTALKIIKTINENSDYNFVLHCVGAIQDQSIYRKCQDFITNNGLNNYIKFHGTKSPEEINTFLECCDINISTSKWETFGRGIYEGMAAGIPSVVFNKLSCVKMADNVGLYPFFAETIDEFSKIILKLIDDENLYNEEAQKGKLVERVLNEQNIYNEIRKNIKELTD